MSAQTVGMLIALYERAVGFYASLVNINAYHQPGVEAGKKAAAGVLDLQRKLVATSRPARASGSPRRSSPPRRRPDEVETVFKVLEHLAANQRVKRQRAPGAPIFSATYSA